MFSVTTSDAAVATTVAASVICPCAELLEEACGSPPDDALDDVSLVVPVSP